MHDVEADVAFERVVERFGHGGEDVEAEGAQSATAAVFVSATALNWIAR